MIVPRLRLILLTAVMLLPASALAACFPRWTPAAVGLAVLWTVTALIDAASGDGRFKGLAVSVPDIVRLTVDREAAIPLEWMKPGGPELTLRLGLVMPAALAAGQMDLYARMPADSERIRVTWPCRALRRGRFPLDGCVAELPTRWGLWAKRRRFPLDCEVRAYPNLRRGQTQLLGLFSRRDQGLRLLRRVGKGREFEQLRDYLPGDNYEDIDWKATARRRHPITRVFQVEQSQEIYLVLDASRLSTRSAPHLRERRLGGRRGEEVSGHPTSIFERYVMAALVMALAADRAADRFGLLVFDTGPDCFIRAGRGRAHYNACREALYNRMPRLVSPDFDELFTFIGTRIRKRALLVFLTHLDDPLLAENFLSAMRLAGRRHVMMVNMFRPPGAWPLFSSPDVRGDAGIYEHLAGHQLWSSLNDTRRKLRQYGAGFALLDHEQLCSQLVGQYLDAKQRQIL